MNRLRTASALSVMALALVLFSGSGTTVSAQQPAGWGAPPPAPQPPAIGDNGKRPQADTGALDRERQGDRGAFDAPGPQGERDADMQAREEELQRGPRPPTPQEIVNSVLDHFPPQQRGTLLQMLNELCGPEMREAGELTVRHPDKAQRLIGRCLDQVQSLLQLREANPEAYEQVVTLRKLEHQAAELGEKAKHASGKEHDQILAQMKQILGKAFDIKQQRLEGEAQEQEAQVEQMRKRIKIREKNRDAIINKHARELAGEMDDLAW